MGKEISDYEKKIYNLNQEQKQQINKKSKIKDNELKVIDYS